VQLSVLTILVLRFARIRRYEQRLSSELEAARAVQSVLMPAEIPAVPGYEIQSVYQPAGEVGGDFFQIILLPEKGALVAIGDVSGKGMPAALTVSLLVGALQTAAESSISPAAILTAMNRRRITRSFGGFTTRVILRVASNRCITVANAGHRSISQRNGGADRERPPVGPGCRRFIRRFEFRIWLGGPTHPDHGWRGGSSQFAG